MTANQKLREPRFGGARVRAAGGRQTFSLVHDQRSVQRNGEEGLARLCGIQRPSGERGQSVGSE